MGRIQLLPPALASQIAAGEVLERPASAVKELLENSLDAEATRCDVTCDGGGVTALTVSDDGLGMSEEDAKLCVERHATSKLRKVEDLNHLLTFGFRGEALPSMASVSRFTLRTRARDADFGVHIDIEAGNTTRVVTEGMPIGTTIELRDLFFNVPARRKFLRSTGTESAHVTSAVEGAALSRPDVTFTLTRDGRRVRELLRVASRRDRVEALLPEENLTAFTGERGPLHLEAHLSPPERARPGAVGLSLVVNGRIVKDRMIAATVAQAYGPALSSGNYPRGVVYLELPPELVDVNVHPQKTEVRFVDSRALSDAIYSILSRELASAFALPPSNRNFRRAETKPGIGLLPIERPAILAPRKRYEPDEPAAIREPLHPLNVHDAAIVKMGLAPAEPPGPTPTAAASSTAHAPTPEHAPTPQPVPRASPESPRAEPSRPLTFLAQVRQSFLVCEGDDALYVVDQHAAAERATFTSLLAEYEQRAMATQSLLFPVMVALTPRETDWLDSQQELCRSLGFDVRIRSAERVSVHSMPKLVRCDDPESLIRELLGALTQAAGGRLEVTVQRAIALLACRGCLRNGEPLSPTEAQALVASLEDPSRPLCCHHDRALLSITQFSDLERQLSRR